MFDSITSLAGPVMTVAGVATGQPWLAAAGIAASTYSATAAQKEANASNQAFAQQQSAQQMAYQTEMSNTSYQRVVKDLEAAGLNPMLAYSQGGASTPTGASNQATVQPTFKTENATSAIQGAQAVLQAQSTAADVQLKNQQANTQAAQQNQLNTQSALQKAQAAKEMSQTYKVDQFGRKVDSEIQQNKANATLQSNSAVNVKERVAPSADPYWYRDIKSLGSSAYGHVSNLFSKPSGSYQLFSKPLGK
ncbi:MAG: DNA pilot protein [Arizlama microvirus]|nr:MAG: DNA pilot protein [Arizlama microvirus]